MKDSLIVGVDVGSGSAKASVFDLTGCLRAQGRSAYRPHQPAPGVAEYDAVGLQDAVVAALAEAVRAVDPRAVASVAVDAMMSGAVPIDVDGRPSGPYTTTLDTRFATRLSETLAADDGRLRALTGSGQPTLGPKIGWLRDSCPEIAARSAKYVLAGGLVAGHLAGLDAAQAFMDTTYIWTTGLADARARTWSSTLCTAQGIDPAVLPRIVEPTDVVGAVTPAVAARTGLRAGTPVVAGCGDQAAGYVGAGCASLGRAADSAGTYAVFAGVTATFATSTDADAPDVMASASGGLFNVQTMVIGGGLTRQWAQELLGAPVEDGGGAPQPAGARGVRFIPHLGGQAYPSRPHLRGAWLNLSWAHTREDLYAAVLEAVALDHAHAADRMREQHADVRFDSVVGYGGGAQSARWNQIKADALGVRYDSLGDAPVAGLGVALLGAQGVGLVTDAAAAAAQAIPVQRGFDPDPERHARYRDAVPAYQQATQALAGLSG